MGIRQTKTKGTLAMSPEIVKMLEKNRDENFDARMQLARLVGKLDACITLALGDLRAVDILPSVNLDAAIKLLATAHQAVEDHKLLNRSKDNA
jgi:hypothetical protein